MGGRQRLGGRLPVQPAGGVLGQVLFGSGSHRARTSSSLSSVTLSVEQLDGAVDVAHREADVPEGDAVQVVDGDAGLGELVEDLGETAGHVVDLDAEHLREVRREAGVVQQRPRAIGVGEDETDDAVLGSLRRGEPADVDAGLAEDIGDFGQTTAAVLEEHGELRDLHDSTSWLATAARPSSNARRLTSRILAGTAISRPRRHCS